MWENEQKRLWDLLPVLMCVMPSGSHGEHELALALNTTESKHDAPPQDVLWAEGNVVESACAQQGETLGAGQCWGAQKAQLRAVHGHAR